MFEIPEAPRPTAPSGLDAKQRKAWHLKNNFRYMAEQTIKIETKDPVEPVKPLKFNAAQIYVDYVVNLMLETHGWVRLIIVKGRQQGISTYIEARLTWLAWSRPNTKICIISHEAKSTGALSDKVSFALSRLDPSIQPELLTDNTYEIKLKNESKIVVITAGSEESGRSQTAHHDHQSERAFYKAPEKIDAGAGQIVADIKGTERYKESTGNGFNHFSEEALACVKEEVCKNVWRGEGKWWLVFIPWYWQPEYRSEIAKGEKFVPTEEEQKLLMLYKEDGLTDYEQLKWRREKIFEFRNRGGVRMFKQEYPCTLMEAFQASGDSFFDAEDVMEACKSSVQGFGPVVIGVDPGRVGDRTVIIVRQGREVLDIDVDGLEMSTQRLASKISKMIDKWDADKCFIDSAKGEGAYDLLKDRGYKGIVELVNFGESAENEIYLNKRAEMFFAVKAWLQEGECNLPDREDLRIDFAALPDYKTTEHNKIKFPKKEEIKEKLKRSTDILDAFALTFAYPVRVRNDRQPVERTRNTRKGSGLTTRQRAMNAGRESQEQDRYNVYGRKQERQPGRMRRWGS